MIFDPGGEIDASRAHTWRLNVAAGEQGLECGRFAVNAVAQEACRRGQTRITVFWVPGEGGPEDFYRRLGFRPTGEGLDRQVLGEPTL
jgi:diamine N-acetyltransferase